MVGRPHRSAQEPQNAESLLETPRGSDIDFTLFALSVAC